MKYQNAKLALAAEYMSGGRWMYLDPMSHDWKLSGLRELLADYELLTAPPYQARRIAA